MSKTIFTVTQLNQETQKLLEGYFGFIYVEGEISNLSKPSSGHYYFSLKDENTQIRCAMFRLHSKTLGFTLNNGLLVQVYAKVSLYPDRGDYQLIVHQVEMAGDGFLRQAYEKLLKKLSSEGLFQDQFKKPIPTFPQHIGVITSLTAAALKDVLSVLKRRWQGLIISLYPTKVQGSDAAAEIVQALSLANRYPTCDVLILARGGGRLEDLQPFNEERVARAIFDSKIPIITGIGHEIDFTIADLVADKRAPTPSAAAELVSPNVEELLSSFAIFEKRLKNYVYNHLQYKAQRLDNLLKRLRHPDQQLSIQKTFLNTLITRLQSSILHNLKDKKQALAGLARALDTMSPLSTLDRGYSIVMDTSTKKIIRSINDVSAGSRLEISVSDGKIESVVT